MKTLKYIRSILLVLVCAFALTTSNICVDKVIAEPVATQIVKTDVKNTTLTPLAVVASPKAYLNKTITLNAKFDKFSTLGLDYNKALRPSSKYIGILIQRDDVVDHNIPLSEMKLFMKKSMIVR